IGAAIVSISVNPTLFRLVEPANAWLARRPHLLRWLGQRPAAEASPKADPERAGRFRAVIVGYGPVGRAVARLLRDNEIEPTVIELNLQTVRQRRDDGVSAVYGDASHRDTLHAAGVETAAGLVLSSSGLPNAQEIIRLARDLNPQIR